MNKESFEEFENLCSAVFGNVGNGNTPEARERLESICLQPSFVEKAETIFQNSKNIYALHATGTSLTTIMTDYWNNFDIDQKLRIRDFILEYVIQNGYQLPSHITNVLCTLICRITSLSWMVDTRQRSIFDLMLQYTNAREHSVLALSILEELVNQISPTNQSSIQQNKTAIQFRDSNLLNILQLSFNLLKDTSQQDDAIIGSSQLRYELYERGLKLIIRCCSFDNKTVHIEDAMDTHPTMTLPSKWLPDLLNIDNVNLLHFLYKQCTPPLTCDVLEVLLWLLSASRSDIYNCCTDNNLMEVITANLLDIMSSGYGLDDSETIHLFVQVLDRFKSISSPRQLTDATYQNLISCASNFTQVLLSNLYDYSNSLTYLFHYWYSLCSDTGRFTSDAYQTIREYLQTNVIGIINYYINKRLSDCSTWVNDKEDDVLMNMESIYWELYYVGCISRFQYESSAKEIIKLFDDLNKQYMNEYRRMSTMRMTGMVNEDVVLTVATYECKLAWLINLIGSILKGEKFTSSQMEKGEELLDAELCKRVFSLNHSISYRVNSANYSRVDPRLEISFINFFNSFREVFSVLTRQGVTDISMIAMPTISGIKMSAFNRFFEKMGIGDFTSVMNVIVEKVCNNLRNWCDEDKVVESSLHLFLELSEPYYGCKLLLQLESIDFMLQNHTEDTFKFLASPSLLSLRTTYYASLTKLVLMDNIPGRLEMFLTPFSSLLQRFLNENMNNPSYGLILMKLYKDLRGVIDSCNDKRSYNIVFETLFEMMVKVMTITVECFYNNDELIGCMFKCLQSFVNNRNSRVDSGSTSTNGIVLFKSTANIICLYTQRRLVANIDYNQVTESLYRCIRLMLQIMYYALNGKYVPFGVFSLYNDGCLRNSLEACMTVILQMPAYQVEKRRKLGKAAYNFIDILFMNHLETLSQMSSEYFISLVRFVVNGIDSYDSETVAHCADCVDQLATFYYLNRQRSIPTMERLQNIVNNNPTLWNDLFEKIMNSLLFNKGSGDILSRPIQSIFLVDSGVADSYYGAVAATQPNEVVGKLKDSMLKLTTDMDVTLEPTLRDQFCEKCRSFRTEVLSYLVL